ncbi:type IX secretion system protein PorQ [Leeuwenhoekiella sp. W20_SRS_FM14]|uniref:type IX secretion system protein PorQ n=1 Tax=Leeuwenhoekiella sp. W20_SRS_FM14 TaxID=3240270 RepID=UPI003F973B3C
MIKKLLVLISIAYASGLWAQLGGRSTYQFLNLVSSPKQAAMGGKVVTDYSYDPTAALFNPATINAAMDNQLSLNYVNYLADVNYGTASYAYLYDRRTQVIHAGVTYVNYGNFSGYDEQGNATSDFSGGEVALSLGYAYNIPYTDLFIGANLKLISSKLEQYNSLGGAIDLGFIYVNEDINLNIGGVVRNLGTQLTAYDAVYEKLPLEIDIGISQQPAHVPLRWHFTLENLQNWNLAFENPNRATSDLNGNSTPETIRFFDEALRHMIIGAELFPDKGFNIRVGYNLRRAEELRILDQRSFAGLSAGFCVKFNKLRLSYSYARYNSAASSGFFGLNMDLR